MSLDWVADKNWKGFEVHDREKQIALKRLLVETRILQETVVRNSHQFTV